MFLLRNVTNCGLCALSELHTQRRTGFTCFGFVFLWELQRPPGRLVQHFPRFQRKYGIASRSFVPVTSGSLFFVGETVNRDQNLLLPYLFSLLSIYRATQLHWSCLPRTANVNNKRRTGTRRVHLRADSVSSWAAQYQYT